MGTDVYLYWDGMSEELKKIQVCPSIDAGRVGKLRASIMMEKENQILRKIFPNHWDLGEQEPKRYKFSQENYKKLQDSLPDSIQQIRLYYTYTIVFQIDISSHEKLYKHGKPEIERAVIFYNSLIDFFELGMEKEREGKKPKVYISS